MTAYEYLCAAGLIGALLAVGTMLVQARIIGSAAVAAGLSGAFAGFSAITLYREGVVQVWSNHTANLWGVQVWWDLLLATGTALFLILPRARAAGMAVLPWTAFVTLTASIGLLAMAARLFWLERVQQEAGPVADER